MITQAQMEQWGYTVQQQNGFYVVISPLNSFACSAPQTTPELAWERASEMLTVIAAPFLKKDDTNEFK